MVCANRVIICRHVNVFISLLLTSYSQQLDTNLHFVLLKIHRGKISVLSYVSKKSKHPKRHCNETFTHLTWKDNERTASKIVSLFMFTSLIPKELALAIDDDHTDWYFSST